eukprot:6476025-Amphidinium_carterae.2
MRRLQLQIQAAARVPVNWSKQDIHDWLSTTFGGVAATQTIMDGVCEGVVYMDMEDDVCIEAEDGKVEKVRHQKEPQSLLQVLGRCKKGGARNQRVQSDAICAAAYAKLQLDLKSTQQGMMVENRLIRHILNSDLKCARSVFQAQSASQRAESFAAALHRAGLTHYASGIEKAAKTLAERFEECEDDRVRHGADEVEGCEGPSSQPAVSDPYQENPVAVAKKRGRPPKVEQPGGKHVKESVAEGAEKRGPGEAGLSEQLMRVTTRLEHLEKWAHGMDARLRATGQGDTTPMAPQSAADGPGHMDERVAQLSKEVQALREVVTSICESGLTAAATSTGQGVAVVHGGVAPIAPTEKHEIGKLWALYHRLQKRLDDMGLVPEVSVIYPKDRLKMAQPTAPVQEATIVSESDVQGGCMLRLEKKVEHNSRQAQTIVQVTNTMWPWLTATAAKVQELQVAVAQLVTQGKATSMRMATMECNAHALGTGAMMQFGSQHMGMSAPCVSPPLAWGAPRPSS